MIVNFHLLHQLNVELPEAIILLTCAGSFHLVQKSALHNWGFDRPYSSCISIFSLVNASDLLEGKQSQKICIQVRLRVLWLRFFFRILFGHYGLYAKTSLMSEAALILAGNHRVAGVKLSQLGMQSYPEIYHFFCLLATLQRVTAVIVFTPVCLASILLQTSGVAFSSLWHEIH